MSCFISKKGVGISVPAPFFYCHMDEWSYGGVMIKNNAKKPVRVGWVKFDVRLMDCAGLDDGAKVLYCKLLDLKHDIDWDYSAERLSDMVHHSPTTIKKYLSDLCWYGLIKRYRKNVKRSVGCGRRVKYRVMEWGYSRLAGFRRVDVFEKTWLDVNEGYYRWYVKREEDEMKALMFMGKSADVPGHVYMDALKRLKETEKEMRRGVYGKQTLEEREGRQEYGS